MTLPQTQATLRLPMSRLADLPQGAGYHAQDGKTRLSLTRHGDSLVATASTDSQTVLPTLTERTQRHHTQESTTSQTTTAQQVGLPLGDFLGYLLPLAVVLIALLLWQRRRS